MPLTPDAHEPWAKYRDIYRSVWLDDIGGIDTPKKSIRPSSGLRIVKDDFPMLGEVTSLASKGVKLMENLESLVLDQTAPAEDLQSVSEEMVRLDKEIEDTGFHNPPLGPVTRMFIFAKENIQGSNALELASQMKGIYGDLKRRLEKIAEYEQGFN